MKRQAPIVVIIVAAAIVRVWAARDELWLDEIGSLLLYAHHATSPLDIFTRMPDSNNHHLMTLWMYVCGLRQEWFVYRVPSLLAGVGTVMLAGRVCRRWGQVEELTATWLTSCSFVLITYASEARGYALAGFFSLLAFLVLERFLATPNWKWSICFGLIVMLGFTSHLTFIFFYFGALAWSLTRIWRASPESRSAISTALRLHLPGFIGAIVFWSLALRDYFVGGAPGYSLATTTLRTLALVVGSPFQGPYLTVAAGLLAAGLGLFAILTLIREKDDLWVLCATTVFIAPAVFILTRPAALFERFFYVSIVFALILMAYLLGQAWRRGVHWRQIATALLVLVSLGNVFLTLDFLKIGRGNYQGVIAHLVDGATAASSDLEIKSDEMFRNQLYSDFYLSRVAPNARIRFHTWADPQPADWVLLSTSQHELNPPRTLEDPGGRRYQLDRVFPYSGLSGLNWVIYRRSDGP